MITKLLLAYDPDMAYPLIDGIEYPYSIKQAFKYFSDAGCNFMPLGFDEYRRALRKEAEERRTRYNFI
jgi:hypothetical protein